MLDIFEIIREYNPAFLSGLRVTLNMCFIVWFSGLIAGGGLSYIAYKFPTPFYYLFSGITLTIIAIPLLVMLYWFHYPFQQLIEKNIDPFYTATITLSAINIFLTYQILIEALRSFPKQFLLASKVCGLNNLRAIYRIQLPIIARQFIPSFVILQVFMLQSSIFASNISVQEIFRKAQQINAVIKQPIEIYTAMAIFFILVCLPLYAIGFWLRKKYSRDFSEQ